MPQLRCDGPMLATLNRRAFLRGSPVALPLLSVAGVPIGPMRSRAGDSFPGLILRKKEPENLEFPFATLDTFTIPNDASTSETTSPFPSWMSRSGG